ncbi:MAG: Ada metal-binding domain-containing protein [Flammeovirgaceae bacterium]
MLRNKLIALAGNRKLKIYGLLTCPSGKRMKKENRVFFESEKEAVSLGYRPCGHCLRVKYKRYFAGHLSSHSSFLRSS